KKKRNRKDQPGNKMQENKLLKSKTSVTIKTGITQQKYHKSTQQQRHQKNQKKKHKETKRAKKRKKKEEEETYRLMEKYPLDDDKCLEYIEK
ncbi:hypothetical protein CHS0354_035656, partial [Potamilus streckersoni]